MAAIPEMAQKIADAAETGGMVEMTRGDFHSYLKPETQKALAPVVRSSPDALTAQEAKDTAVLHPFQWTVHPLRNEVQHE